MRQRLRSAIAAITAMCLGLATQNPILIAAETNADQQVRPLAPVVEVFTPHTRAARRVVIDQGYVPSDPAAPTLNELRERLRREQGRPGAAAERNKRLLQLLDIASIENRAERHARIRSLPVELKNEFVAGGTFKSVFIHGKLRARLFVPDSAIAPPPTPSEYREESLLFDQPTEHEDREIETTPPAASVVALCEDEEGWAECATDEEIEDTVIVLASIGYEADIAVGDAYEVSDSIDWYCYNNPGQCMAPLADGGGDHESAPPCFTETVMAAATTVVGADLVWTKFGIWSAAKFVTSRAALAALGVSAAAVAAGVVTVAVAYNCYIALNQFAHPQELIARTPESEPAIRLHF